MRKKILIFVVVLIVSVLFGGTIGIAYAEDLENSESDLLFIKTVEELSESKAESSTLNAVKEPIYDINLAPLGYLYDFNVNGQNGYAIITETESGLNVNEIYFNAVNPYVGIIGKKILVGPLIYAGYSESTYELKDFACRLSKDEVERICDKGFCGTGGLIQGTQEINYAYRTVNYYNMSARFPSYTANNLSNSCSPTAGGNIIAFFDRNCINLIPNYSPGSALGSKYLYKSSNATTASLISQLYSDMGTNTIVPGTTEEQFKLGMDAYCTRQGYNITYNECVVSNNFSYSTARQQIDGGKPIALFLSKYNVNNITETANKDTLNYFIGTLNHMMVGFGYKEINYTFSDGSSRTDYYLNVASGISEDEKGYFNVNVNSIIDKAYAINIY